MKHAIELGQTYVDAATGYRGRAVSIHYYEYACERVVLESFKDGEIKAETFDLQRLKDAETGELVVPTPPKPGGDRTTVAPRSAPARP